jgi:hypothetical protein
MKAVLIVGLVALFLVSLVCVLMLRNIEAWPVRLARFVSGVMALAAPITLISWGMSGSISHALARAAWQAPVIAIGLLVLFRSGGRFPRRKPMWPPLDGP